MTYSIYAFILDGVVKDTWHTFYNNVTVADMRAKAVYGDNAYAIDCSRCYVVPGDTYANSKFYRNGVELTETPNYQAEILSLQTQVNNQSNDIDDLIISLTPEVEPNV